MDLKSAKKKYKIVVLGDSSVGKTTITYRACENKFLENVEATIGVDLRSRVMQIHGEEVKLEFWDTAGQERHRQALHITYYRNADAVILVYDVTNLKSFENLQYWLSECKRFVAEDIPYVLIGNKCDQDAMVSRAAAQRFADTNGMLLFETSCCDGSSVDNVEAIFYTLAQKLKENKPMAARFSAISIPAASGAANNTPASDSSCSCALL